ncbi:MAG: PAS domain S-box protein, partial [Promethearchaeota archaeon]
MKVIGTPKDITRELTERTKELNCIYQISDLLNQPDKKFDEMLEKIPYLIQSAMESPHLTSVIIRIKDNEFKTQDFKKTDWRISNRGREGEQYVTIDVYSVENSYRSNNKANLVEEIAFKLKDFLDEEAFQKQIDDLKNQQTHLEDSEKKFRFLYENAPLAYQSLDHKGNILDVNGAWLEFLGYEKEEVIGKWFGDFIDPEYLEDLNTRFPKFKEDGEVKGVEYEIIKKDGSHAIVAFNGKIGYDENMNFERTHCIFQDITKNKLTDQALKDSEEKFRRIFETIPDLFFLVDREGTHLEFKGNEEFLFLSPKMFLGKTIKETLPPEVFEKYDKAIKDTLETRYPTIIEYSLPLKDEMHFYEARNLFFSEDRVAIFVRDITIRKQIEKELIESEEKLRNLNKDLEQKVIDKTRELYESERKYRELFNHMTSGVAIYNVVGEGEDFAFKDINKAGEKISEVKKEEIIDRRVSEIFPGVKDLGLFDVFKRVWETGNPEYFPTSLYHDEKISHWVENHVYKLPTGEIVAVYDNLTAKKNAEFKLKESEVKFKSIFINSPIGIELYDSDGKLVDVNQACLDMFGARDFRSVEGFDLFQDPNISEDVKFRLRAGESIRYESEFDFAKVKDLNLYETTKLGKIYLDVSITPIYHNRYDTISNYLVQVQDITNAKQAEKLLEIQNRISRIFLTVPDDEMYSEVLGIVLDVLKSNYGVFGYIDEQGNSICPSMTRDIWEKCQMEDTTIVFPKDTWGGIWGKCLIEKRPVYSNVPLNAPKGHVKIENALSVPIVFQDASIGHFNVANKIGGFNQNDIELLKAIANWTAKILNARLQRDIQEKKRKKIDEDLKKLNEELEQIIEKRTKNLKESETRLKIAQKIAHVGDWEYNIRNNMIIWSEKLYRIYDTDQNIQLNIEILGEKIHPDDRECYDNNIQNWIENGEGEVFEYRIVANDSSIRFIYGICDVILGDDGKPIKIFGTFQDITERKIAENKLKESENKYKLLANELEVIIDHIPGIVVYKDTDNNILRVNKFMVDAHNLDKTDMEGKSSFEFYPYEEAQAYWEDDLEVINSKTPKFNIVEPWETLEGRRWVNTSKIPYIDEEGNVQGVIAIAQDISDMKIAEDNLKKSEEKYRRLIEDTIVGVWVIDSEFNTKLINPQMTKILGYTFEEMISKSLFNFMTDKNREYALQNLKMQQEGTAHVDIGFEFLHKTGVPVFTQLKASTIFDENGNFDGAFAFIADITDKKKALDALRTSETKFRLFVENFEGIAYQTTPLSFKPNFFYGRVKEISGYEPVEFIEGSLTWDNIIHPEDLPSMIEESKKVIDIPNYIPNLEYRIHRKDGEIRWVRDTGSWIYNQLGEKQIFQGAIYDITNSKSAEEKIRAQNEFLKNIIDSLTHPFYVINVDDYTIEIANSAANFEILSEHMKCHELIHNNKEPCQNENPCPIKIVKNTKKPVTLEHIHYDNEGGARTIEAYGYPIIDQNGNVIQLIEYNLDITDRKKAEELLKESEEKFSKAFHSSPTLMAITRIDDGYFIDVNETYTQTLGYSREELIGYTSLNLNLWVNPEQRNEFTRKLREQKKIEAFDVKIYTKSGKILTMLFSGDIIYLNNEPHLITTAIDITDRIKAEQNLKESELRYRSLFENMTAAFAYHKIIVDDHNNPIDYEFLEANSAFEKFTNLKVEDIIGKKVRDVLPGIENDPADWIGKYGDVALTGEPITFENYSESLNQWYNASAYSPKKNHFAVTFTNITERKEIESRIKESEEMFRTLTEQSLMGICIAQDNQIKYINQAYSDIWGYTSEEMMNWGLKDVFQVIHPDDRDFALRQLAKKQMGEEDVVTHYQYRSFKKSGELIWVDQYSKSIIYESKSANFITIIDITDRKEAQIEVEKSEENWRILVEDAPDIIFTVDRNLKILFINNPPMGISPEQAIGTSVLDYMYSEYHDTVRKTIIKVFETGIPDQFEISARGPNDNLSWYSTRLGAIKQEGEIVSVMLITTDITERKKMEEHLRLFETIIETSQEPIAITNSDGKLIYINPAHQKLFGRSLEEARKMNFRDFYPAESVKIINSIVAPKLSRGESWEGELDVFDVNGRRF